MFLTDDFFAERGDGHFSTERDYQQTLDTIIKYGKPRADRTGVGTVGIFGDVKRWNLRDSFPLLTTKKMFWKGIVHDLLWMIAGGHNANDLAKNGVHVWDANANDYKAKYPEAVDGELGPIYGYQWRNFNGQGCDQIAALIDGIRRNPNSRRHIVTTWNPLQIEQMALPPCLPLFQMYVIDGEIGCMLYQRSADMFLGVPFDIAEFALLTHMVAHVCKLRVGEFVHCLCDAHVYLNHVDQVKEQVAREPLPFPKLRITREIDDIFGFKFEDFELVDYKCHQPIKAEMAV